MIQITNVREKYLEQFEPIERMMSISDALDRLVIWEIGMGGRVLQMTETKIVIRTSIMGAVDTNVFEGSATDMLLLREAIYCYYLINSRISTTPLSYDDDSLANAVTLTLAAIVPTPFGSFLDMGPTSARACLIAMMKPLAPLDVVSLNALKAKELISACALVRLDGATIADVVELAALAPVYDNAGKICGLAVPA